MNKTQSRIEFCKTHVAQLEAARTQVTPCPMGGQNARSMKGMSGPGWGLWAKALSAAGINPNAAPYWSGSAPTPSTAINGGIADYIRKNAPKEII